MNADLERRLFADSVIFDAGEWIVTQEWIAHRSVELPPEWMEWLTEPTISLHKIIYYVDRAREATEVVSFGEPEVVVSNGTWNYEPLIGDDHVKINADVRVFFEELTPGCEWVYAAAELHEGSGPMFARRHPERGVLFVVAGYDKRRLREAREVGRA